MQQTKFTWGQENICIIIVKMSALQLAVDVEKPGITRVHAGDETQLHAAIGCDNVADPHEPIG